MLMSGLDSYHACGRHDRIRAYNEFVQSQIQGKFATVATAGNIHEVNYRDKVVLGSFIEKFRSKGNLSDTDFEHIPFNLMDAY